MNAPPPRPADRRPAPPPAVTLSTPRPAGVPAPSPAPAPAAPAAEAVVTGLAGAARGGRALVRRLSPRQRRVLVAVLAAVAVLVPAAVLAVRQVAYRPEEPVADYVAALNDGDPRRAAELAGCASRLCRPDALGDGFEPPTGVGIVAVTRRDDIARVRIGYTVDGTRHESTVVVERRSGWVFPDWRIASGATGQVEVVSDIAKTARVGAVQVPAVAAPASGRSGGTGTAALPGRYTVAADDDPLFTAEPVTLVVAGDLGTRRTATLTAALRPGVAPAVDAQVRARLDACAAVAEFAPRRCPIAYQKVIYKPANPQWTIDAYPAVTLTRSDRPTTDSAPLVVRTATPGRATVRYTSDGVPQNATVEFEVRGTVSVDQAGAVTWTG